MQFSPLVQRLREKPKEVRAQVSFLAALCVTGVIGVLWGLTIPTRLSGLPQSIEGAQAQDSTNSVNAFLTNTRNNLGQLISANGDVISESQAEDVSTTPPTSDAYIVGAPEDQGDSEGGQPVVTPVSRREVRIATTTRTTENF